ncbi:SEL1-like repeat protein [Methylocystis iwaonis]|uniref:Peptidoglycan-binding protein n=1 Tax=Methylocystis iwaonis TaxID=2885079 RepID=A0ABN6VC22_9HYPH|nr:peptidoglycan-binding protein [Methylocystis iwaonis]BDV33208.1 hypothetical protein SS37A_07370 [Methylocystis iwaonis]
MSKGLSRKYRGPDYEPREAARAEARRSGKSLGDWLDDAIREPARDDDEGDFDADGGDRLEEITRRLARPSGERRHEREDFRQPRRWRDEVDDRRASARRRQDDAFDEDEERSTWERDDFASHSQRGRDRREPEFAGRRPRDERRVDPEAIVAEATEVVERRVAAHERQTARAFENLAELIKRGQRGGESAAVKRAVSAFAERADANERHTARALKNLAGLLEQHQRGRETAEEGLAFLAERLGRIESRLAEQPSANASVRPIRSALARLESRLDRLAGPEDDCDVDTAPSGRDRRRDDISRRLEDEQTAPAATAAMGGASSAALEQGLRSGQQLSRRPLADAIAEITQRQRVLDDFAAPSAAPAPAPAADLADDETPAKRFTTVNASLDALLQQVEGLRQQGGERADQQLVTMRQIEGLRREIEEMARAVGDLAPRASVASVESALRDLSRRIETQRDRGVAADLLAPAEGIAGELRAVVRDLDPSPILRSLDADVQAIGRRLDAMQAPDAADMAAVRQLATQAREIKDQLGAMAARPLPLEKIETRLFDLTQRVEGLAHASAGPAQAAAALDMGELVRSIRSIVASETGTSFETFNSRLEYLAGKFDEAVLGAGAQRFDELGQRIDALGRDLGERIDSAVAQKPADTASLEHLIANLGRKIDSVLDDRPHAPGFEELGRKLERLEKRFDPAEMSAHPVADRQFAELAQRIDVVRETLAQRLEPGALDNPQLDEIARRLERMHGALTQRAEDSYRVETQQKDLTALVEQLATRMNQALDPRGDAEALKALESQIGALSQRLDRNDRNGAALSGVESRIAALVAQMEETKAATTLAAEEAVRRATQDILRQANPAPGALREALERELADIRKAQDEAGERTHETLLAVHETLERVVDRLAMFEDELSDMRSEAAAPAPAAPFSAPAASPRRGDGRAPELAVEPRSAPRSGLDDAENLMDLLVQPGAPRPQRREPGFASPGAKQERSEPVQTDFIAAARRAAQQAAMDAEAAEKSQQARRSAARPASAPAAEQNPAKGGLVGAIQERKRPLLLGLGALVLLIGAYQIARVGIQTADVNAHANHEMSDAAPAETAPGAEAPVATPAEPAPAAKAAAPAAPARAPETPKAPPPRMIAPHTENAPVDPTPVGSISSPSPLSAPDAIGVIKVLAQQGLPAAQYELAVRYADGRGVARDAKAAAEWFEKAASQGLVPAQYRLGSFYEKGVGVERDYGRARKYYLSAAEAGNARAMHNLAVLLAEGGDGGKPDYPAASEWFRKAAEYGVRDSQYNLAILYARGLGVTQSLTQSYLWFSAAAEQGDADAGKKRDEVAARLDSKELATAKSLAAGFHAKEPVREANDVLPPKGGWESVKDPAAAKGGTKPAQKAKLSAI